MAILRTAVRPLDSQGPWNRCEAALPVPVHNPCQPRAQFLRLDAHVGHHQYHCPPLLPILTDAYLWPWERQAGRETAISMLTAHVWPKGWKMELQNAQKSGELASSTLKAEPSPGDLGLTWTLRSSWTVRAHHAARGAAGAGNQRPVTPTLLCPQIEST